MFLDYQSQQVLKYAIINFPKFSEKTKFPNFLNEIKTYNLDIKLEYKITDQKNELNKSSAKLNGVKVLVRRLLIFYDFKTRLPPSQVAGINSYKWDNEIHFDKLCFSSIAAI